MFTNLSDKTNHKNESILKNSSSVIADLNNLKNEILEKIERVKQLAETINSKIEEKHEFYNGLDLKKCLEGTVNYVFLLEKVCAALSIEIDRLDNCAVQAKESPQDQTILCQTAERIAMAKRTLKNVKKDIQISFSRYEHFFGIQKTSNAQI